MGGGSWSPRDWDSFAKSNSSKPIDKVFTSRGMPAGMDPKNITVRESRDSVDSPNATPIILALDVTGSMGELSQQLAQKGLGTVVEEILKRKPVTNPHIMVMGVGDAAYDDVPLQVSQFEADNRIAQQLKQLYLEGGGGGNSVESYNLPWYFAARKTDIDSVAKRGKKGVLFTFGDEECPPVLKREHIREVFGDHVQGDISTPDLLAMVQQKYDPFHVVVEQGSHARGHRSQVYKSWEEALPKGRVIPLTDIDKIAEVIVSVLDVHNGKDAATVAKSWDSNSTALAVRKATEGMELAKGGDSKTTAIWRPGR